MTHDDFEPLVSHELSGPAEVTPFPLVKERSLLVRRQRPPGTIANALLGRPWTAFGAVMACCCRNVAERAAGPQEWVPDAGPEVPVGCVLWDTQKACLSLR